MVVEDVVGVFGVGVVLYKVLVVIQEVSGGPLGDLGVL